MSMPNYPNYKESGAKWVGRIPAHWVVRPLKHMLDIQNGADHKTVESTEGFPVIGSGGPFTFATEFLYDGEAVLLGRKGTIDKPLHVNGKFWTVDTMYWSKILPGTWGRFAYYVALTIPFDYYSTSTALPSMTKSVLGAHLVARPPIDEQAAIATFLDCETAKIDALVAEQEKLIALLSEKRLATISHAVTKGFNSNAAMKNSGVAWLGDVPAHWEVKRFRDACNSISTGPFGTALGSDDYISGGVPVINPSHIVDNNIVPDDGVSVAKVTADKLSFWSLRVGDIVIARRGELGRAAIVQASSDGWICGTGSLRVTPNDAQATADFLHAILQSKYAREWLNQASVGSTMANLNEGILGNLPIALPRVVDEQRELTEALSERLSGIRAITVLTEESIALLRERRSALIAAAVTGQIDVRGVAPEAVAEISEAIAA